MSTLLQDLRFGLRILAKNPGFTAVAVLTLALGIGANTAIFSLIYALMLHALPVQRPDSLVQVRFHSPSSADTSRPFSNPVWEQVRDRQNVFSGVFVWSPQAFDLSDGGEARMVHGIYASGGYFSTLGVRPVLGRMLTGADDFRGCGGAAVLGYGFWQQHYGGAGNAIGNILRLNGHSFPVVGVAQKGFFGTDVGDRFEVAIPLCAEAVVAGKESMLDEPAWWLLMMGRLKPGVSRDQAAAGLNVRAPEIFGAFVPKDGSGEGQPGFRGIKFETVPAATGLTGYSELRGQFRQPLAILMIAVVLVLVIACANVASLLVARSAARRREIAIRLALGASRGRLIRQVLTESLLISGASAVLGILFARWSDAVLVRLVSTTQNRVFLDLSMGARVLAFTVGIASLSGIIFGILPAFHTTSVSPVSAAKGGEAQPVRNRSRLRAGRWVVSLQVGLSLVLLVGMALFVFTFRNLLALNPGFERKNVLLVTMNVHNAAIPARGRVEFYGQVVERLDSLPGVLSVGQTWFTPFAGAEWNQRVQVEDSRLAPGVERLAWFNGITPGYFATMRTPLLAGRNFNSQDTASSPSVAIVNEVFAHRFFPNVNPIGKYFRSPNSTISSPGPLQIVGVVEDSKYESLREGPRPFAYLPLAQMVDLPEGTTYMIRIGVEPSDISPEVAKVIGGLNKAASLRFATLTQLVDDSLATERVLATLSGFFGALAIFLTAIGLYGVMSYAVTWRTQEIGIRMALGARKSSILKLVGGDLALMLATGIAGGTIGALWVTRFVQHFLFGLKAQCAQTLLLAVGMLVTVALAASFVPIRRATKLDPMVAIRYD